VPSSDPILRFEDILDNILLIEQFTAGMDMEAFSQDLRTSNAVERCLERISEAAKSWECAQKNSARPFGGPNCEPSGTSSDMNTTKSRSVEYG
jgi:hypothetical protein